MANCVVINALQKERAAQARHHCRLIESEHHREREDGTVDAGAVAQCRC
jgi:hypothetical protein